MQYLEVTKNKLCQKPQHFQNFKLLDEFSSSFIKDSHRRLHVQITEKQ